MLAAKKLALQSHAVAFVGEFVGTSLFLFLALGGAKTALAAAAASGETVISIPTLMFIAVSFGFSLLCTAWIFFRVSGALFNPAITLSLALVGAVSYSRAAFLVVAEVLGGIVGAALVEALTEGGVEMVITRLGSGVGRVQGMFLEAILTAALVMAVLMLAAEKHKATHIAPIGIGLTLFVGHLYLVYWTGCGMNPVRSLGPSVISGVFPSEHWVYYAGPFLGSLFATLLYVLLKVAEYELAVAGQDADTPPVNALPFKQVLAAQFARASSRVRPANGRSIFARATDDQNQGTTQIVVVASAEEAQALMARRPGATIVDSETIGLARGSSYIRPVVQVVMADEMGNSSVEKMV